jgi:hypothetical protein
MLRKILILLAGLLLVGLLAVACAQPAPTPVKETVVVTVVVPATAAPAPAATAAPTAAAPIAAPTAAAKPPNAEVRIVPVAANASKDPNVLTATVKLMTDTVAGAYNATIAMGATGLNNVPVNVPVHVQCMPDDPKFTGPITPTWTLYKPTDSKAALKDTKANKTEFTPDMAGAYAVTCGLPGGGEVGGVQLHTGSYIGVTDGKCETCHAKKVEEWKKTGHANIFTEQIDLKPTHYTESCASCHTTGWYAEPYGKGANGFKEVMTNAKWSFPTFKQIEAGGNWAKVPAAVKNMANIQCEQCHGPAADHVKNGAAIMATSQDEGVCNVCHNGSSRHDKGEQLKNAAHSDKEAAAFNTPVGPGEQACVRCHSGNGYASFLDDPTNPAAWDNSKQTIVCATCHDPHSDENAFQLRIVSKPVALPFEVKKDVGLSATCFECHNSRVNSEDFMAGKTTSNPHYSRPSRTRGTARWSALRPSRTQPPPRIRPRPSSCSALPTTLRATFLAHASPATCGPSSPMPKTRTLKRSAGTRSTLSARMASSTIPAPASSATAT